MAPKNQESPMPARIFVGRMRRAVTACWQQQRGNVHRGAFFVPTELGECTHVFVRVGISPGAFATAVHWTASCRESSREERQGRELDGREVTVSADRVKPAFVADADDVVAASIEG
ncbi:hypothetical protein U1Q18_051686 [Sarracenia purpurea var. burkii]